MLVENTCAQNSDCLEVCVCMVCVRECTHMCIACTDTYTDEGSNKGSGFLNAHSPSLLSCHVFSCAI